eukprot:4310271-Pyramimonas_sp.AAC.1
MPRSLNPGSQPVEPDSGEGFYSRLCRQEEVKLTSTLVILSVGAPWYLAKENLSRGPQSLSSKTFRTGNQFGARKDP